MPNVSHEAPKENNIVVLLNGLAKVKDNFAEVKRDKIEDIKRRIDEEDTQI